ncbi:MAG TPA: alpha/beta fold hydrolase [Gaiellaceae bacterium]|nr:alpha/beta fold hydrolase [Gaiellaceae bacterium]
MADETTRRSIRSILNPGRMLSDGIPYPDYQEALERVATLEAWFDFWAGKGELYESLGDEALAAGNRVSGGEWLWHASLSFHYAQFMWFHDPERRESGQRRKVELYERAAPHLVPPGERVEIPFEGATIPAVVRLPLGEPPRDGWPCVLLLGGLESTKEESLLFENMCLERGIATVAFDGPGQGELFFQVKLQPDFERYTSAVVDDLEQRDAVDVSRLGVLGRSLGGFYALRSAAFDERLRACVAWGFFYDMTDFESMPPHTQRGFTYVTGRTGDEARKYLQEALRLEDAAARLRTPALLLNGAHDPIFPPRQMELAARALAGAPIELVIEPDGDHCCHNMGQIVRPRMADWIAKRLAVA